MKTKIAVICLALLASGALNVRAQQGSTPQDAGIEQRVALDGQPIALDSLARAAIAGQLLTKALAGTPDAPVKNVRFIIENRSASFYNYVSGSVTFYDERGVRCGEGQFTLNALAPGEQVETDAPGLRLSCTPATWRLVANNLLTRTTDAAKPVAETAASQPETTPVADNPLMQQLEIVVDDRVYNAPMGSTLDVSVRKRRVKITVRPAQ
ncbi:MAG TPA: FxLYD domain-containing protein [Pyrinomonadaceae bacterium]|nr:FxLYD domain-containing protein [Pyrinomonadaceae bacterium]